MTFTEGASYSLIILVGLGIAAAAGYAVFKELIFEPKEYESAFSFEICLTVRAFGMEIEDFHFFFYVFQIQDFWQGSRKDSK